MTTYTKITDFASKDALLTGNPSKIIKGVEIGAEFDAIVAADADNLKASTATGTGVGVCATSPSIASPTITGHAVIEGVTATGATGTGKFVFAGSPTLTTPTIATVTSPAATDLALNAPTGQHVKTTINGATVADVASTGLTVTGNINSTNGGLTTYIGTNGLFGTVGTTPNYPLDVVINSSVVAEFSSTGFVVGGTMRVNGNCLFGGYSSNPPWWTSAGSSVVGIEQATTNPTVGIRSYSTTNSACGALLLGHSNSAVVGTLTATATSQSLGCVAFEGVNSSLASAGGAYILATQTGAAGATYLPTSLNTYVSDGTTAPATVTSVSTTGLSVTGTTTSSDNFIPSTAAKGINFTANTGAAGKTSQLLNWYEEGTWTPAVTFGGGSTGITYTSRSGFYTRIGNAVTVAATFILSSKGSSTGAMVVSGLPFTSANVSNKNANAPLTATALAAGMTQIPMGQIGVNTTTIGIYKMVTGTNTAVADTDLTNTSVFVISSTYYAS